MSLPGLEILNLHAEGGMAEVYRARGAGADGVIYYYALKKIRPELVTDPELVRMFVEEARVASALDHPGIVKVFDLTVSPEGEYYIVMEFMEGKDLCDLIDDANAQRRRLPVWLALQVAREVLLALDYANGQARDKAGNLLGLIHRDLSPHNVFICRDGRVKIMDFGVAKVQAAQAKTQYGVIKGKFGYMSPEQLRCETLDVRSDIFNVGILMYESITGRRLFNGDSPMQLIQSMMSGHIPALPADCLVPPDLEALMRQSLAQDRNQRPKSAGDYERALAAAAQRHNLAAVTSQVGVWMTETYGPPPAPVVEAPPELPPVQMTSTFEAAPQLAHAPAQPTPLAAQAGAPIIVPVVRSTPPQAALPSQASQPAIIGVPLPETPRAPSQPSAPQPAARAPSAAAAAAVTRPPSQPVARVPSQVQARPQAVQPLPASSASSSNAHGPLDLPLENLQPLPARVPMSRPQSRQPTSQSFSPGTVPVPRNNAPGSAPAVGAAGSGAIPLPTQEPRTASGARSASVIIGGKGARPIGPGPEERVVAPLAEEDEFEPPTTFELNPMMPGQAPPDPRPVADRKSGKPLIQVGASGKRARALDE